MHKPSDEFVATPRRMRRSVHAELLKSYGLPISITAAARASGIPYSTLISRIARGKNLTAPVRKYGCHGAIIPNIPKSKPE